MFLHLMTVHTYELGLFATIGGSVVIAATSAIFFPRFFKKITKMLFPDDIGDKTRHQIMIMAVLPTAIIVFSIFWMYTVPLVIFAGLLKLFADCTWRRE